MFFGYFSFCYRAPIDSAYETYPITIFLHFKYKNYHGSVILHDIGYLVLASMFQRKWRMNSALLTRWTHTVRIKHSNANVDDYSKFHQFVFNNVTIFKRKNVS